MRRILPLSFLALLLTVSLASPALADTNIEVPAEPAVELPQQTAPQAIDAEKPEAEGLMSPAEPSETNPLLGPADELRIDAIRACTYREEQQCPPGCGCVVINNAVRCFCP